MTSTPKTTRVGWHHSSHATYGTSEPAFMYSSGYPPLAGGNILFIRGLRTVLSCANSYVCFIHIPTSSRCMRDGGTLLYTPRLMSSDGNGSRPRAGFTATKGEGKRIIDTRRTLLPVNVPCRGVSPVVASSHPDLAVWTATWPPPTFSLVAPCSVGSLVLRIR